MAGRLITAQEVERARIEQLENQLRRLELAGERLEGNVSPELVVDALALGWRP
ncbi:hypothetical protein D3C83_199020 [compost metagenome]